MADSCGDGILPRQDMWLMRRDYGKVDAQFLHDALTDLIENNPDQVTNWDKGIEENIRYATYTAGFNAFSNNGKNPYTPEEKLYAEFERGRSEAQHDYNIEQEGYTSAQDAVNPYDVEESKREYYLWQLGADRKNKQS